MSWQQELLLVETRPRRFHPLTDQVAGLVRQSGLTTGLCHVFLRHTSASLCITENADPDVRADLERYAQRLIVDGDPLFSHDAEGPDDMPAHLRCLLVGHDLTVPIRDRRLALGTWQGIYLWEHRTAAHRREVIVTLNGSD